MRQPTKKERNEALGRTARLFEGDRAGKLAEHTLVEENIALCYWFARKWKSTMVTDDEFVSIATLSLIETAATWDPDKGTNFAGWLMFRLRNNLYNEGRWREPLSMSREAHRIASKIKSRRHELFEDLGRFPTTLEIAESFGLTEDQVAVYFQPKSTSLDDTDDLSYEQYDVDQDAEEEFDRAVDRVVDNERTARALQVLDERLEFIVRAHYGIGAPSGSQRSLQDIADEIGVSREWVRKLLHDALRLMREADV